MHFNSLVSHNLATNRVAVVTAFCVHLHVDVDVCGCHLSATQSTLMPLCGMQCSYGCVCMCVYVYIYRNVFPPNDIHRLTKRFQLNMQQRLLVAPISMQCVCCFRSHCPYSFAEILLLNVALNKPPI